MVEHTVRIPVGIDQSVIPSLNAFLMSLTHLPIAGQVDVLDQATDQISEAIAECHNS